MLLKYRQGNVIVKTKIPYISLPTEASLLMYYFIHNVNRIIYIQSQLRSSHMTRCTHNSRHAVQISFIISKCSIINVLLIILLRQYPINKQCFNVYTTYLYSLDILTIFRTMVSVYRIYYSSKTSK